MTKSHIRRRLLFPTVLVLGAPLLVILDIILGFAMQSWFFAELLLVLVPSALIAMLAGAVLATRSLWAMPTPSRFSPGFLGVIRTLPIVIALCAGTVAVTAQAEAFLLVPVFIAAACLALLFSTILLDVLLFSQMENH